MRAEPTPQEHFFCRAQEKHHAVLRAIGPTDRIRGIRGETVTIRKDAFIFHRLPRLSCREEGQITERLLYPLVSLDSLNINNILNSMSDEKKEAKLYKILQDAIRAVPSVKYALGIVGISAAVAMVILFFTGISINYKLGLLGIVTMLGLMTCLLIFSALSKVRQKLLAAPGLVIIWGFIIFLIASVSLCFTSFFFQWPKPLSDYFTRQTARFTYANAEVKGFADFYGKEVVTYKTNRLSTKSPRVNVNDPPTSAQVIVPTNALVIARTARWVCSDPTSQDAVEVFQSGEKIIARGKLKRAELFPGGSDYWGEILLTVQYTVPVSIRNGKDGVPLAAHRDADKVTFTAPEDYGPLKSAHIRLMDGKTLQIIDELTLEREFSATKPSVRASGKNIFEVKMSDVSIEFKLL